MELKLPLLVYDADCPMCVRFKQGLERFDVNNRVSYVPLTDEEVFKLYPQLNRESCRAVVHYVREDGSVVVGGEVITEPLKHFPGAQKLAWLLESEMGRKTAEFFYQKVEAVRQKILSDEAACGTCKKS